MPHRHRKAVHEKQMPFVAGEGACPSALSRAPVYGVHRSEAKTLAQEKRTDQAQGLARKGSADRNFLRKSFSGLQIEAFESATIKRCVTDID